MFHSNRSTRSRAIQFLLMCLVAAMAVVKVPSAHAGSDGRKGTAGASEIKNRGHVPDGTDRSAPFRIETIVVW